jgi:SAM-dependent methyltransferase
MTEELPDHVRRNRSYWDGMAHEWVRAGERKWRSEPGWGVWHAPESELNLLPDLRGKDAIELGCGTAYVSSWLARRGARVVGIDNSAKQLETARSFQDQHDLHFPLIHGNAENVPYQDFCFDLAVSEYGAAIWCDPYLWIPEAARLLRPGGRLVFLGGSPLHLACVPQDESMPAADMLLRPCFGMHRFDWGEEEGVEFHLPHGKMLDLLRESGFEVVRLVEIQAPDGPEDVQFQIPRSWAKKWPAEDAWIADRL